MKIFIASLATETNTFSPLPTGYQTFAETMLMRDASRRPATIGTAPVIEWRRLGEADGHTVVESLSTFAQPAGRTIRSVYEAFRGEILDDLRRAMPVDMVLLFLHGAMVAEGYDDCEGDMLRCVRDIVGRNVVVGAELDLHCHLTEAMLANATAINMYKEYPHTDTAARAADLYRLGLAAAQGRTRPTMAMADCRMVNMWRTPVEPMRGFVDRMSAMEGKAGVLSVSFGHGFPWGDVEDVGARMLVITDNDKAKAARLAEQLAREIWDLRQQTVTPHLGVDEALDRALAASRAPVVLADVADNAGGGAPSDSTFILRRAVDRGISGVAIGSFWDPLAVRICKEAGVGADFDLRVGGKCGRASGDPVDLKVTVKATVDGHTQTGNNGGKVAMGDAVWVRADPGIDLILNSLRTQTYAPDAFTGLGIDPTLRRIVVVKSTQHFYARFAPIASEILYVSTPGAIPPDFASIPYTKRKTPYWPRVEDPFA
jgi:microcystin degradation protein MlrC